MSTQASDSEIAKEDPSEAGTKVESDAEKGEANDAPPAGPPAWLLDAPDGGLEAWLVVLGAWCCSFVSFGWLNSIGIFQQYYETVPLRHYSPSTVAWIPSLQLFFMMFCGPAVGILFDKYGPRYLILGGTFLHVFGLMMASLSTKYYQLLLSQGVVSAIGVAAIFQPALSCIMGWFNKKRGNAYGILATGSSLGGVIFPIMVNRLIKQRGFGWAMRISAFLILGLLVIANLTVKKRTPPGTAKLTREQMAKSFTDFPFLALAIGMATMTFGIYVPVDFLAVEGVAIGGVSVNLSQYIISIYNAGSLFGRLGAGILSDKIGKYNVFIVCCYMSGIITLALWIPNDGQGKSIAYAALYGFFSGAYVSLIAALVAQISVPREIGYRTGLVFLAASIPSLTSNPISGAILDHAGGWNGVKVWAGVLILAGTAMTTVTRVANVGWKLSAVF